MKKWFSEYKKPVLLSVLGTLLPMVIGLLLWNRLPETMTTHWGADGVADGFSGKAFSVIGLPAILAALDLLCMLVTAADPRQRGQNKKALGMVFWIMPLISLVACSTVYAVAMGKTLDMTVGVPLLLGALFVIIGNYMPKVKQNYTLGIKMSWTLRNEENWNKTHRFAGKVWVAGGVLILLTVLLPFKWAFAVLLVVLPILVLAPVICSYCVYKSHKAQGIDYPPLVRTKGEKRITASAVLLVILILAGTAVLMFTGDIAYTHGEDALRIKATYDKGLTLSYEAMDSVELREDFSIGMRMLGFNSARLSMGAFQNEELGNYTVYAYNACDSMILIRSGEKWLAINAETPEETQQMYQMLLEKTTK